MLRKASTGTTVWKSEGGDPPPVVVDNAEYLKVFDALFPARRFDGSEGEIQITWGRGDFEMICVNVGMTARIGTVSGYKLKGQAYVGDAASVPLTPHRGDGVNVRTIIGDNAFDDEVREVIQALPGQPHKPQAAVVSVDVAAAPPAEPNEVKTPYISTADLRHDPATFVLYCQNIQEDVLLSVDTWAALVRTVPEKVKGFLEASPIMAPDVPVIEGRCMVGFGVAKRGVVDTKMFNNKRYADGRIAVLNTWIANYQVLDNLDWRAVNIQAIWENAIHMLLSSIQLYLLECGAAITEESVIKEIEIRAQFIAMKDAEYGQATRRHGIPGVLTRVWDKYSRYINLVAMEGQKTNFESRTDSAKDLGGYSLILVGLLLEFMNEPVETKAPE
jgi:hypothetical protein